MKVLKNTLRVILAAAFAFLLFSAFIVLPTYAAENDDIYDPATDINYIKYIDVTLIPTTITSNNDTQALVKITYEHEYDPLGKNEKLTWYIDGTSSTGKAYASIISYDTNGNATVLIAGTTDGVATLIFHGIYHERTDATAPRAIYQVTVEPYETVTGVIKNILTSNSVLVLIITLAATVIGRSSIKIFRFGVNYKSTFATTEQQDSFEKAIREEIRVSKTEIQDNILKICLREINRETRPLKELQELASTIKTDRQILNVKMDSMDQKYNEIRKLSDNISKIEQTVNRLQYGDNTAEIRRSGK